MRCSNCDRDNPDDAKFCVGCDFLQPTVPKLARSHIAASA